jgi:hypothetical protein
MATIESLLRDEPTDIPADIAAPQGNDTPPDDPCCTPIDPNPGPDQRI